MDMGAQRAEAQSDNDIDRIDIAEEESPRAIVEPEQVQVLEEPEASPGPRRLGMALALAAVAWTAASGWALIAKRASLDLPGVLQWAALLSGPLILLGLAWLIFGRTSRNETERFTRAVKELRGESAALESLLAIVANRLEENHARLTGETAKLMSLSDEASDRLGRVTHYLSKEGANLDKKTQALEQAAEAARVDMGVMLQDLPRAEEHARSLAASMREAGLSAHEQAGALEGQLSALVARGREADEVAGGAAQRLAAHLARIESTSEAAAARVDEAAVGLNAAIDGTMARAAEAFETTRSSIDQQSAATLALIEQSRASFERAGDESGRSLANRLEQISTKIQDLASHLAAQDAASQALVAGLGKELSALDERFAHLQQKGESGAERLAVSLGNVQGSIQQLFVELGGGSEKAAELIDRSHEMAKGLLSATEQLNGELPAALSRVEEQAERTRGALSGIVPKVEAIQLSADGATAKLNEAETSVGRQQEALDALLARVGEGVGGAEEQLQSLATTLAAADVAAAKLAHDTGPELVEALIRVRETANQAAERARESIAIVIPQCAAALGEASRKALTEAVASTVAHQVGEMSAVAERAVEAARKASEGLTRQMLTIGETAAKIETRIENARKDRLDKSAEGVSRRVALLIESLNSTAIDVTKILSNEVTDSAWAAYLKGDRGVFTRRAVRLLDAGEARAIVQHYEDEPDFREQVNRYIHDFEAMLRQVLADRDGSPLGVTILSSDMGKLYVALAQAIERLR